MKRLLTAIIMLAAILTTSAAVSAQGNASLAGNWEMTLESPQGTRTFPFTLQEEGGKLVPSKPFTSAEVKGKDIKMQMTVQFQGNDLEITYTGKIDGDGMKGDADFGGFASGTWSAKRKAEGATPPAASAPSTGQASGAGLAGSWDMTIDSPQGKRTILLIIANDGGKYSGKVKTPQGEAPLKSVAVNGSDVTLVMEREVQGQQMEFTFKGKASKDKMGGDADFGGFASGTWEAVPHKGEAASAAPATAPAGGATNVTGAWSGSVETSQGSGTPTFTFKQDGETLTGTYSGQLGDAPLKGTVKGNDIAFSAKVSFSGQDLELKFTGKIEGNTMKGKANYDQLGEATWSAKKK